MTARFDTCMLCPRLCRPACPVATGTAREAAVPTLIATAILRADRGEIDPALAAEAAALCTDCGACEAHCHIHQPLPALLREARARLLPTPSIAPLGELEGEGAMVAIEADERPMASALAAKLGRPVRRLVTPDRLGVAAVEHGGWRVRAEDLRRLLGSLDVVVADGGVAHALERSDVPFRWLAELVPAAPAISSCRSGGGARPLACCGAGGPLARVHPEEAVRVGLAWLARAEGSAVADARCRDHLRRCGGDATDPLDALLEELG